MLIVNTETVPGKEYDVLGIVKGNIVTSKHVGRDIAAGLKSIVGGELAGYTEMLSEARATATARMINEAQALRADAVVNVRYASAAIMQGSAEMIAYGTAVKFK